MCCRSCIVYAYLYQVIISLQREGAIGWKLPQVLMMTEFPTGAVSLNHIQVGDIADAR